MVRARRQPFPADARLEVDRRAAVGPLDVPFRLLLTTWRPWSGSCRRSGGAAGGAGFGAPKSSSSDIPSSLTIEYSVLTDGRDLPVSICEIALGETPSRRASSRRLSPRCSR